MVVRLFVMLLNLIQLVLFTYSAYLELCLYWYYLLSLLELFDLVEIYRTS